MIQLFGVLFLATVVAVVTKGDILDEPFTMDHLTNASVHQGAGCRVSFSMNAFIPSRLGTSIPGERGKWFTIVPPGIPIPLARGVFGNTDDRGFGGGSSKMKVNFNVPVSQIGRLNSRNVNLKFNVGNSIIRGKYRCLFRTCTQTFSNEPGKVERRTVSVTNPARGQSRISFKYAVGNGGWLAGLSINDIARFVFSPVLSVLAPGRIKPDINPNVDMDIAVNLKKVIGREFVVTTVDVRGKTDSFPDYEAFVNGRSIYQRRTRFSAAWQGIVLGLPSPRGPGVDIGLRRHRISCRRRPATPAPTRPRPPSPPRPPPPTTSAPTPSECSSTPTVRRGGGPASVVRNLQTLLNRRGGFNSAVDGIFGPPTERAVIDWQTPNGLLVDGIVGPQTWASLCG